MSRTCISPYGVPVSSVLSLANDPRNSKSPHCEIIKAGKLYSHF